MKALLIFNDISRKGKRKGGMHMADVGKRISGLPYLDISTLLHITKAVTTMKVKNVTRAVTAGDSFFILNGNITLTTRNVVLIDRRTTVCRWETNDVSDPNKHNRDPRHLKS